MSSLTGADLSTAHPPHLLTSANLGRGQPRHRGHSVPRKEHKTSQSLFCPSGPWMKQDGSPQLASLALHHRHLERHSLPDLGSRCLPQGNVNAEATDLLATHVGCLCLHPTSQEPNALFLPPSSSSPCPHFRALRGSFHASLSSAHQNHTRKRELIEYGDMAGPADFLEASSYCIRAY